MKIIAVLNGKPTSGKDTFAKCCGEYVRTRHISSVGLVKQMALKIGWDGAKDDDGRLLLSNLKKTLYQYHDTIFKDLKCRIMDWYASDDELLFIDIREPDEIERAVKEFKAITVLVDRDVPDVDSNASDMDVLNYQYDYVVDNNGTMEDLSNTAYTFVESLKNI